MGFGQRLYSKVASVCSRWASYCAANQRNCLPSKPGSWSYPYVDVPMSPEARRAAGIDVDYAGEGIPMAEAVNPGDRNSDLEDSGLGVIVVEDSFDRQVRKRALEARGSGTADLVDGK